MKLGQETVRLSPEHGRHHLMILGKPTILQSFPAILGRLPYRQRGLDGLSRPSMKRCSILLVMLRLYSVGWTAICKLVNMCAIHKKQGHIGAKNLHLSAPSSPQGLSRRKELPIYSS